MKKGFSLLEIIVVIALIAMISGLVAVNYSSIIRSFTQPSIEKSVAKALREARHQASILKDTVALRYNAQKQNFVISNRANEVLIEIASGFDPEKTKVEIRFLPLLPQKFDETEWHWIVGGEAIDAVLFSPEGVSTPFGITINTPNEHATYFFDPFSSRVIEVPYKS